MLVLPLLVACANPKPVPAKEAWPEVDAGVAEAPAPPPVEDPWLWLEEIDSPRSLEWVKARNAQSTKQLESAPQFAPLKARLRSIYDSKEKIPWPTAMAGQLYNLWKDEAHPRGLWRRTTLAEFKKAEPKWEPVLDVDALAKAEQQSWVWKGVECLAPKYERCLVRLSPGGGDAAVVREFDTTKKAFVENGFSLPAAKSRVAWRTLDELWVGTDFGQGTLTASGYPRLLKRWKRGTPLADATLVLEGEASDVLVTAVHQFDHGKPRDLVVRARTFFSDETFLVEGDALTKFDKPDDATIDLWDDRVLLTLRTDWVINERIFKAGSLLTTTLKSMKEGKRDFEVLFEPTEHTSLDSVRGLKTALVIKTLEDVRTVLTVARRGKKGWEFKKLPTQGFTAAYLEAYEGTTTDDYLVSEAGFTTPETLFLGNLGKAQRETLKALPAFFKADGLEVTQHFATSADGTKVPYFQVAKQGLVLDGTAPTLLEGYGGFEVPLTPEYDPTTGAAWLEKGGVYVLANIRGGGEYGPAWHQAALREKRQRAYDDFQAIAKDLVARKVTSSAKLGILGGSNGGLLMGVMLTQAPELFGAVVCLVPLLDMKRYHLLLAGASWMEEYGDPGKPEDWGYLEKFSPYQNVKQGVRYPKTLFATSTRDDRVHPGHARKMVARMLEQGHDVAYFENTEGGHAGAADAAQRAQLNALAWTFLSTQLGLP